MIILPCTLAAAYMWVAYMNIKTNPLLSDACALCVGINIGFVIAYASGVL